MASQPHLLEASEPVQLAIFAPRRVRSRVTERVARLASSADNWPNTVWLLVTTSPTGVPSLTTIGDSRFRTIFTPTSLVAEGMSHRHAGKVKSYGHSVAGTPLVLVAPGCSGIKGSVPFSMAASILFTRMNTRQGKERGKWGSTISWGSLGFRFR